MNLMFIFIIKNVIKINILILLSKQDVLSKKAYEMYVSGKYVKSKKIRSQLYYWPQ